MKNARSFATVLLLLSLVQFACSLLTPTQTAPQVETDTSAEPSLEPNPPPSEEAATPTAAPTARPVASPTPTTAKLQLEILQSQTWTDYQGNARVNVLLRNPYDFPVAPTGGAGATLFNNAGEFIRFGELYFLDGISGGNGFFLPGETIAANACFTCEAALLTEEWASVEFGIIIKDASESWDTSTEVEASGVDVSFDGDSPIFWVTGTVKNNSDSMLSRISVRVVVFDQDGKLVGAAETSAWDVGPGATASVSGYGIGETPAGSFEYEVTALGVNY